MTKDLAAERAAIIAEHGVYVTPRVAATIVRCHPRTLARRAADGELRQFRIGRSRVVRYRTADVLDLLTQVA